MSKHLIVGLKQNHNKNYNASSTDTWITDLLVVLQVLSAQLYFFIPSDV